MMMTKNKFIEQLKQETVFFQDYPEGLEHCIKLIGTLDENKIPYQYTKDMSGTLSFWWKTGDHWLTISICVPNDKSKALWISVYMEITIDRIWRNKLLTNYDRECISVHTFTPEWLNEKLAFYRETK